MRPTRARLAPPALLSALLLFGACRDADQGSASLEQPIVPSAVASSGCTAPGGVWTQAVPLDLTGIALDADHSRLAAAADREVLYLSAADGRVLEVDVTAPAPVFADLATAGALATWIEDPVDGLGFDLAGEPARASGLAVLDDQRLVVMEHTANFLVEVGRDSTAPDDFAAFAGAPNLIGGSGDACGILAPPLARFHLTQAAGVAPTGDGRVFVADPGNHAVRSVLYDPAATSGAAQCRLVQRVAGTGLPGSGYSDAADTPEEAELDLGGTLLDTPVALAVSCQDELLVCEAGGDRIRELGIGAQSPFGFGFLGRSRVLVGGPEALFPVPPTDPPLDAPSALVVTTDGELWWIDTGTGILRRLDRDTGVFDCPLAPAGDCQQALAAPTFSAGGVHSLAQAPSGVLYALDATAGALYRLDP